MGPEWDDSVPARIVDDVYEWTQQGVAPRPIPVAVAVDEEIVPQPVTQVIDEVYEIWPYVEPVETIVSLSEPGGGPGAPDVAPQLADDEGWINEKAIARAVREAFTADDEIVPQPAVLGIDDETWQAPIVQRRVDARVFLDDDLVVTAPGGFVPDEQYELQLFVEPLETRVQLSEPGGGGPATTPAGEPLGVDELYWLQLRGYQRPATLFTPPANDEITQPAAPTSGVGGGGFPIIARYSPEIVQWEIADELPQPAVPLPIAEEYDLKLRAYRVQPSLFTAPANDEIVTQAVPLPVDEIYDLKLRGYQRPAVLYVAPDGDQITQPAIPTSGVGGGGIPQVAKYSPEIVQWEISDDIVPQPTPQFEDDSWHLALWMPRARDGLHLPDPSDEWVAPPVPLPIDENEWPEAARHWVATPVLGLYLPDPEEIPADSLVPLPIVETPNDGAVWPLPKYPQRVLPEEIRRQQRMVQEYLDELDARNKKVQSKRLSARERKAILTGKIEPRLTQAMALAASDEQIKALAENALAAKVDREAAQAEFKRRYWAAALSLMMFE
jgi:hypothetical protein